MYGRQIGQLARRRGTLSFTYTSEALALGGGLPLLSVALPSRGQAYNGDLPTAFFEGLLPEGEARRMIAYDFGLGEQDVIGLLRILGRDCAGALVILPEGEEPESEGAPEPLAEAEVAQRLDALRHAPLGVDERVRVSLAGAQEKLLLARLENSWGLPIDGAPSTHILKPAHRIWAAAIANEAFCLRLARHLGINVAEVALDSFAGVDALVVERYDRRANMQGQIVRVHQEDFCQAHGLGSRHKYEDAGGPSLKSCAETLNRWSSGRDQLESLLDTVTVNLLIGNADAHAKNFSLLHDENGQISLAPAYDLMSTIYYEQVSTTAGMFVDGKQDISEITAIDLITEAASWGLPEKRVKERLSHLLDQAPQAIEAAAAETQPPEALVAKVLDNAKRFG